MSTQITEPKPPSVEATPEPAIVNGRWSGYLELSKARMRELFREPEIIFWVFVFPILLALGLGIAFRNKPADVSRVAIVQGPRAQQALELIRTSANAKSITPMIRSEADARNDFRLAKFDLVIVPREDGGFEYQYDPARPESNYARTLVDDALQSGAGRKNPLPTSEKVLNEPGARYIDFLIPGLLGMNLMNAALWGIGFGLVDMRQRKLLKRFLATPLRRSDFLLVLATNRLLLTAIELAVLVGFGILAFQMRVVGSWATILLVTFFGAISFGGLGLLVASRAQKIESVSGLINLAMMPMWIFSGVFFSYEKFPAVIQPIIKLLPLTALNDALRSTILEGAGLAAQGPRLLILALWGGLSFALALKLFRWN